MARYLALAAGALLFFTPPVFLHAQDSSSDKGEQELAQRIAANPADVEARSRLAELYLQKLELEKALEQWRKILELAPEHPRASEAVSKLAARGLDARSELLVMQELLEGGVASGIQPRLDFLEKRAFEKQDQALLLYLKGLAYQLNGRTADAWLAFTAVSKGYPATDAAALSEHALARMLLEQKQTEQAREKLEQIVAGYPATQKAVALAALDLVLLNSKGKSPRETAPLVEALLAKYGRNPAAADIAWELARLHREAAGGPSLSEVQTLGRLFADYPTSRLVLRALERIGTFIAECASFSLLDEVERRLKTLLTEKRLASNDLFRLLIQAMLKRAAIAADFEAAEKTLADAESELAQYQKGANRLPWPEPEMFRAQFKLVEGEKAIVTRQVGQTVWRPIAEAASRYMSLAKRGVTAARDRLSQAASLYELSQEWHCALDLYLQIQRAFPHTECGRNALERVVHIQKAQLQDLLGAVESLKKYNALYPPPSAFYLRDVKQRLKNLGFGAFSQFQKAHGLKVDGYYGKQTESALTDIEKACKDILPARDGVSKPLQGRYVHDEIFEISETLARAGRFRDAISCFSAFLNLFPTNKRAGDALYQIGLVFRQNLLLEEAMGALKMLIQNYPNQHVTSEGHLRLGECHEDLGQWAAALEVYDLYVKKFPRRTGIEKVKERIEALKSIAQYQAFLDANPDSAKWPEAQYGLATLVYKNLSNMQRATCEYQRIFEKSPSSRQAVDALFTAGTAALHAENFPKAREIFALLLKSFPESRLADDAQYWIGHTHEYHARTIGKLDTQRIVLKKRSVKEQRALWDDMELRKSYCATTAPPAKEPRDYRSAWLGDTLDIAPLVAGAERDRVLQELQSALTAYWNVVKNYPIGDMAEKALVRIAAINIEYLNQPEKAVEAHELLLKHYPQSRAALDAQLGVGTYYMEKAQYEQAIKTFQTFIYNYSASDRVEEAMILIADCYKAVKDWQKALDAYESYLTRFPSGQRSSYAKEQVEWIKRYGF